MAIGVECPNTGIEGRKELILGKYIAMGERIQEGRLARVRVAHGSDFENVFSSLSLNRTFLFDLAQTTLQKRDSFFDETAIDFDLLLAHAAASRRTAALPLEVRPEMSQSGQNILESRKRDLRLGLFGARMLRENLDDHAGPVKDRLSELLLEIAKLIGREFKIQDDCLGLL